MLTTAALDQLQSANAASNAAAVLADRPPPKREKKYIASKIYDNEVELPKNLDLGLKGVSRAQLRAWVKESILEASFQKRRKYSQSALSSALSGIDISGSAKNALKQLQKERLIVSRLGFPDRAMEIDAEIDRMTAKVTQVREQEEKDLLEYRLKMLGAAQGRKRMKMEQEIAEDASKLEEQLTTEWTKVRKRQKEEFMRLMENASRRAIGKAKKCNCTEPYLCSHNKVASYNTRRPTKTVVQYRRNGKRLRQSGRPEEGAMWEEKAADIDEGLQEIWREHIATSLVASPWGANEAFVDQYAERHKKELDVLQKTHNVRRAVLNADIDLRRRNFDNTCDAEVRKVKMQCRKQAAMRSRADAAEQMKEQERLDKLGESSDGLNNVSANLMAMLGGKKGGDSTDPPPMAIDWVPPTTFGVDNSVRLVDAYNEEAAKRRKDGEETEGEVRVMRTRKDIRKGMTAETAAGDDGMDYEDEFTKEVLDNEGDIDGENAYVFGETSGSKLMDRLRKKEAALKKRSSSDDLLSALEKEDSQNNLYGALTDSQKNDVGMGNNNSMGNNNNMGMTGNTFTAPATGWGASSGGTSSFGGGAFGGGSSSFGGIPSPSELSPTAPSMPAPSSPSFQAQSRRPKHSSFEGKTTQPTTKIMNNTDDEDEERNGSDIDDVGDSDDSGEEHHKPQKPSSSSTSNQKKKVTTKMASDWELDSNDDKAPSFVPGSTRDEDWKERDFETAKGYGMENSYGVVTDPLHATEQKHEPPDPKTATPGKSAIGSAKGSGRKSVSLSFGDSTVHEYEVEESQNPDTSRQGKTKGGKEKWGNFFDELKDLYDENGDDAHDKTGKKKKGGKAAGGGGISANTKPKKKKFRSPVPSPPHSDLDADTSDVDPNDFKVPTARGGDNPKKQLTSAALIAMALKTVSREASDDEDNNEDDLVKYEKKLQKEVEMLRNELEVKISKSNSSAGSNASVELARAIISGGKQPPGNLTVPPGVGMKPPSSNNNNNNNNSNNNNNHHRPSPTEDKPEQDDDEEDEEDDDDDE